MARPSQADRRLKLGNHLAAVLIGAVVALMVAVEAAADSIRRALGEAFSVKV